MLKLRVLKILFPCLLMGTMNGAVARVENLSGKPHGDGIFNWGNARPKAENEKKDIQWLAKKVEKTRNILVDNLVNATDQPKRESAALEITKLIQPNILKKLDVSEAMGIIDSLKSAPPGQGRSKLGESLLKALGQEGTALSADSLVDLVNRIKSAKTSQEKETVALVLLKALGEDGIKDFVKSDQTIDTDRLATTLTLEGDNKSALLSALAILMGPDPSIDEFCQKNPRNPFCFDPRRDCAFAGSENDPLCRGFRPNVDDDKEDPRLRVEKGVIDTLKDLIKKKNEGVGAPPGGGGGKDKSGFPPPNFGIQIPPSPQRDKPILPPMPDPSRFNFPPLVFPQPNEAQLDPRLFQAASVPPANDFLKGYLADITKSINDSAKLQIDGMALRMKGLEDKLNQDAFLRNGSRLRGVRNVGSFPGGAARITRSNFPRIPFMRSPGRILPYVGRPTSRSRAEVGTIPKSRALLSGRAMNGLAGQRNGR